MAIEVELPRRLFTVEEYHRMAEAGIFRPDERVELIEGEIVQMAPIGPRHAGCVINANRLFITRLGDRAVVSRGHRASVGASAGPAPAPAAGGLLQPPAPCTRGRLARARGRGHDGPVRPARQVPPGPAGG